MCRSCAGSVESSCSLEMGGNLTESVEEEQEAICSQSEEERKEQGKAGEKK